MADENLISLQPGTIVAGRYEVVKCLGAGSMGLVYACRHRELAGHLVAIKVLFPEVAQDKVAAARFRNEIVASYGVSHPNVVRAYEYFRDGDLVAYTMEFVGGGDLADQLSDPAARIEIPEIVRLLAQITSGVQSIHDAGIVHRDLKPENILLTERGDVKITDFGIARTGHGPKLTEHGGVVGTIDYVSPEYLEKGQVDSRSDIYAMGVLGYEMITGESPFRGDSVIATMTMRLRSDPKPPSSLRSECPAQLDAIILKAMARDPEDRYQTSIAIFNDLQVLGAELGVVSGVVSQAVAQPTLREESTPPHSEHETVYADALGRGARDHVDQPDNFVRTGKGYAFGAIEPNANPSIDSDTTVLDRFGRESQEPTTSRITNIADQYEGEEDTLQEPMRLESVLSTSELGAQSVLAPTAQPVRISISEEGIDSGRIRTLSQSVIEVERPLWIDLVTLGLAVIIGLGVGIAVLNVLHPDFFKSGEGGERNIRILDSE